MALGVSIKPEITRITEILDQESIRHRDRLKFLLLSQQLALPCDKDSSTQTLAYIGEMKKETQTLAAIAVDLKNSKNEKEVQSIVKKLELDSNKHVDVTVPPISSTSFNKSSNFVVLNSLFFESGSAKLTEDAKQKLSHIGAHLKNIKGGAIYLVGNSDPRLPRKESNNDNYSLSVQRAKAVGEELNRLYGIKNYKIIGSADNLTTTRDGSPPSLSYDRRVDIYIGQENQLLDFFAPSL